MFDSLTCQSSKLDINSGFELVNNTLEVDELQRKTLKNSKTTSIVLAIIFFVFLIGITIAYLNTPEGFPLAVCVFLAFFLIVLLSWFISSIRYCKKVKNNFDSFQIYRLYVRLTNKKISSSDDSTDYYADIISEDGGFRLDRQYISYNIYMNCNDGYLYLLCDSNDKKNLYFSDVILDGRPSDTM